MDILNCMGTLREEVASLNEKVRAVTTQLEASEPPDDGITESIKGLREGLSESQATLKEELTTVTG